MDTEFTAKKVWFDDLNIWIETNTGQQRSHPLAWFPRLLNASERERENFTLSALGIHWPDLDEDLSFEGFFKFRQ